MVIGPGKGKIAAFVILADGEYIPDKFNSPKVVIYRKGKLTHGELVMIKNYGELAKAEDVAPPAKPVCNYDFNGNPLHEHDDETWWYYDETWALENGPFDTYEEAYASLLAYCEDLNTASGNDFEKSVGLLESLGLTSKAGSGKVDGDENKTDNTKANN